MTEAVAPAWPADRTERWDTESLIPYAQNARTHSAEQVTQIAKSIEKFGFTVPVLVDDEGTIIAGHGRVMAAKQLGLPQVPVMIATGWSKAQKRAYVIADNKLALNAGWDLPVLRSEIKALNTEQFELELTGFTLAEVGDLMLDAGAPAEPEERTPSGEMNTVIQFNIVFDDEAQQAAWFAFVRHLKAQYPDDETLGARLARHIDGHGLGEGGEASA